MTTAERTFSPRRGRWSSDSLLNALERRYADLQGRYETIEQDCETAVGVTALLEVQDRVESDKKLIKRVLDAIEIVARNEDPDWHPGRVRPIPPKQRDSATGEISRTAFTILRREKRPMTARELARAVAVARDFEIEERNLKRFDVAIRAALERQVGNRIGLIQGPPKRYFILAAASATEPQVRHHAGAANSPSSSATPAP